MLVHGHAHPLTHTLAMNTFLGVVDQKGQDSVSLENHWSLSSSLCIPMNGRTESPEGRRFLNNSAYRYRVNLLAPLARQGRQVAKQLNGSVCMQTPFPWEPGGLVMSGKAQVPREWSHKSIKCASH